MPMPVDTRLSQPRSGVYIDALKALADSHRLRLFWLLAHVCKRLESEEVAYVLHISRAQAVQHLRALTKAS